MRDIFVKIKRLVLAGNYSFSEKARIEMIADGLTELDIAESILNAVAIYKTIRSTGPGRRRLKERHYIIYSTTLIGIPICTKGKILVKKGGKTFYFLVSSKKNMPENKDV
jgi:hypothetical protein